MQFNEIVAPLFQHRDIQAPVDLGRLEGGAQEVEPAQMLLAHLIVKPVILLTFAFKVPFGRLCENAPGDTRNVAGTRVHR